MTSPNNLFEYYQSKGQALPSVSARAPIYAQYGGTGAYTGSTTQNAFLLGKLSSNPTGTSTGTPTGSVSTSSLTPTQPLNIPPSPTYGSLATELGTQVTSAQGDVTTTETAQNGAMQDWQKLSEQLTGQTADTQKAEQDVGLPQLNTDLKDLINLSRQQTGRYLQGIQDISTQFGAASVANTKEAFLNRQHAIDSMLTNSLISAKQGDIQTAQGQVDRAISLKYDPIKQQIQNKLDFLKLNSDNLSRADKKLADAKSTQLQLQLKQIDDAKTTTQSINNIALEAAKNGASPTILKAIQSATDVNGAITAAGTSLQTPNTEVVKLGDGSTVLIDKSTGKTIKNLGGGTGGSVTMPSSVVRTVNTSTGTTPVSGYTIQKGEDPYTIAQNNGIDMATMQQLNPQITDWHAIQPGTVLNLPNKDDSWLNGKSATQIQAYNSIPNTDKAAIKQLVKGDALLTDIVKSRGAQTQGQINKLITEATAIDPNFSINANKQRYSYKQQFNNPNGKEQLQINAINTGLGHLAEFKSAADALGNTILLPYNKLVNYLKKNTGDPKVAQLNTVVTALAGELASVYKGGSAPTDQETEQWRNSILSSFSTSQTAGVASTTANLISNKMLALNNSYKNVMGSFPDSPIINNDVLQQLGQAGVDISGITSKLQQQGYSVPDNTVLSQYGIGNVGNILSQYGL